MYIIYTVYYIYHFSTCLFEVAQQSLANELGFPAMIKGLRKEVDFIDVGPTTRCCSSNV